MSLVSNTGPQAGRETFSAAASTRLAAQDFRVEWRDPSFSRVAPYFIAKPKRMRRGAPILVAVHGISRDAREQLDAFARSACALGWTVVAPLFEEASFPAFQKLGVSKRGTPVRTDLALLDILEDVARADGVDVSQIYLFGYSGGAQFAHRFAMVHPHRVAALALGAAGWYTFPDAKRSFPFGMKPAGTARRLSLRFEDFLDIPCAVYVGNADTLRDASLNTSARLDGDQGATRFERGARWVGAVRSAAFRRRREALCRFETLDACGHSFAECVEIAALDARVVSFFAEREGSRNGARSVSLGAELELVRISY